MDKEVFTPVKGYSKFYAVSNLGNVKSLRFNKNLSPADNGSGYLYVVLCKNNNKKNYLVHRLVVSNFLRPLKKTEAVNHLNKNTLDNSLRNLEVVSYSENQLHASRGRKRGIRKHRLVDRWQAEITVKGKVQYIGLYKTKKEAYAAYYNKYLETYGEKAW